MEIKSKQIPHTYRNKHLKNTGSFLKSSNKAISIDDTTSITADDVSAWNNTVLNSHIHLNKTVLDKLSEMRFNRWEVAATNSHTHTNKEVIDKLSDVNIIKWDEVYNDWNKAFYFDTNGKLIPKVEITGLGATLLGKLTNVEDEVDDEVTQDVVLYKMAGTDTWAEKPLSEIGGGTGGTGSSQTRLSFISDSVLSVSYGTVSILKYKFISTLDGESTGGGTVTYTVNDSVVYTGAIQQGENSFDVTKYIVLGNNTITVKVVDSYDNMRKLTYYVNAIDLSLSSTFDDSQIFNGSIVYKYTPVGAIDKTIHFLIDGVEVSTANTSVSNREQTQSLPQQNHGTHILDVYMTATLTNGTVESKHLKYALTCIETGNMTPIVSISPAVTKAEQYSTVELRYMVYNPASSLSNISISVNDAVISTLKVDRTLQTFNYRLNSMGTVTVKITSGEVSSIHTITVTKSAIDVEAETVSLELYLTSMGRSNAETNRNEWKYGTITSTLTDFNWATNGWIVDNTGNVTLRVQGNARVNIPLKVFASDLRQNGKTIEFEFTTKNVANYNTPVISCWDNGKGFKIMPQEALFVSTQSKVSARFKEEERVRISFVVSELAENRLIHTYINGIASGSIQYPVTDSFAQVNPANITIGCDDATIDIYNIRIYSNNLNRYQLLDNYIADMDDVDKKLELYNRNLIYDEYGNVSFEKIKKQNDILVISGDLPSYKGDKKTCAIKFYSHTDSTKDWICTKVQNDVQGTSSQYYPRKNYKFKFKDVITFLESGATAKTYQLNDEVLPANVFCVKADFAESSGSHNTGLANYVDWLLKQMNILTVPQKTNKLVRTTVAGYPICIFHQADENSELEFIGKYNFNTDKSAEATFGFSEGDESWEFSNNTSDRTNFRMSEYDNMTNGQADWTNDFEARYPNDDVANAEYEAGTKRPINLKTITDWIVSCKGNTDKFKSEINSYMDKQQLIFYWIITLVFGMVDQRAKNQFLTYYHGGLWLFIFYDNDTCLGINNEGAIEFLYNVEIHDVIGSQNVWNGAESELWNLVEQAYSSEIKAMYTTMRQRGYLTYDKVMEFINNRQVAQWCEAIYNEDGYYKYESPLVDGYLDYSVSKENPSLVKTGAYLYAMQGSREMHRKWWLYYRLLYLDSKYLAASVLADTAVFRTYTPAVWIGVKPNANLNLTSFNAMYLNVKWGSVSKSARVGENETYTLTAPEGMQFNDTETIVYGASMIKSLGDLSPLYVGTVDVSRMKRLTELIIGSDTEGYNNTNLRTLSVGNNEMLKLINIRNCTGYKQTVDLSGCENIEVILAKGSMATGFSLPSGGNLKTLELPASIKSLTIKNQPLLTESGFSIEGVSNLTTLVLENTNIDTFALLAKCFSQSTYALERVRLLDVQGTTDSTAQLAKLVNMGGIDENGNDISKAVVTGKCDIVGIYRDDLNVINSTFPELQIKYKFVWIKFADPVFKSLCANIWDINGDREISEEEAALGRNIDTRFAVGNTQIIDARPFRYLNWISSNYSIFYNCTNLKYVDIGKSIGYRMFGECSSLTDVNILNTVTEIGAIAFMRCISLAKIKLPESITSIGLQAFDSCYKLSDINLDKVVTIGDSAFTQCISLNIIVKLTSLSQTVLKGTFYNTAIEKVEDLGNIVQLEYLALSTPTLKYVTLPASLRTLKDEPFQTSSNIVWIKSLAVTPPSIINTTINLNENMIVYVPDESINAYKTASGWTSLKTRIKGLSNFI